VIVSPVTDETSLRLFFDQIIASQRKVPLKRIGGESDGGYLLPDDLEGIELVISPGVAQTATFEIEFAERGVPCIMIDASIAELPRQHPRFIFYKKWLSTNDYAENVSLEKLMSLHQYSGDGVLQMDIEGNEYPIVVAVNSETLRKFRIIVIEFHHLDLLLNRQAFGLISACFEKLLKDFNIVHIHPNNCISPVHFREFLIPPVMEFTFHRKDRIAAGNNEPGLVIPNSDDVKNISHAPDVPLPKVWFASKRL
jgi:hypothetical protein